MFVFFPDYIPLFTKRRGNFHGIQLNGMVEYEPPMTYFPDDFANKAEFFSENQTYDKTEIVDGYFIDSLHSIERVYNFSTKLYKRRDGGWGMPQELVYGGFRPTGMLQNLYEGSAEFIWAPLSGNYIVNNFFRNDWFMLIEILKRFTYLAHFIKHIA